MSDTIQKIAIVGALGLGAFYILRVSAGGRYALGGAPQQRDNTALYGLAGQALGSVFSSLGRGTSNLLGTATGRSATDWDVTPYGPAGPVFNNPSAYVAGGLDGLAVNPPQGSVFDLLGGIGGMGD